MKQIVFRICVKLKEIGFANRECGLRHWPVVGSHILMVSLMYAEASLPSSFDHATDETEYLWPSSVARHWVRSGCPGYLDSPVVGGRGQAFHHRLTMLLTKTEYSYILDRGPALATHGILPS